MGDNSVDMMIPHALDNGKSDSTMLNQKVYGTNEASLKRKGLGYLRPDFGLMCW